MRTIRCVAVLAVFLAAGLFFWQHLAGHDETDSIANGLELQACHNVTSPGYFRKGQWRADARTLMAALDFLLTPEGQNTNQIFIKA